jgi:hypothetical protein
VPDGPLKGLSKARCLGSYTTTGSMPTESVEANQILKKLGSAIAGLRIERSEAVRNEVQASSACERILQTVYDA